MRRFITVLGAIVVGLIGILTLHPRAKSQLSVAAVDKSQRGGKPSKQAKQTSTVLPVGPVSVTGPVINYGFGQIAVKVAVSNRKIVGISIAQFRALESYSIEIEQAAVPRLTTEALKAQGLPIAIVSGATYTSQGFAYSLQGALNKLKGAK